MLVIWNDRLIPRRTRWCGVRPVISVPSKTRRPSLSQHKSPKVDIVRGSLKSVKVALGCADPCYCKMSLRFSSNSALSISPFANRSFKISRAREAVSYTSDSSSRRDLRLPTAHDEVLQSLTEIGASSLPISHAGPVRRAMPQPRPRQSRVRPCSADLAPKPVCTIGQGRPSAQLDRLMEAAVRRLRCAGAISAVFVKQPDQLTIESRLCSCAAFTGRGVAGNCSTLARWPSHSRVSSTISPSGNSNAS